MLRSRESSVVLADSFWIMLVSYFSFYSFSNVLVFETIWNGIWNIVYKENILKKCYTGKIFDI